MSVEPLFPQQIYMTYDGENRMTAFSGSGGAASYSYDGNGLRVVKSISGGTTTVSISLGGSVIAEYDNGAAPGSPSREYIYNGAGLLAMVSGGATTYYHQDHLSVRLTTDGSGNILTQEGHFPFGEQWYQSGSGNKWIFTSYQRDSESGLDYALARYYDSRTGTFCSADPLAGSPDDPQSWNRYPYGRNDPIDITDPSGQHWWNWLIDIGIGVAAAFLPAIAPAWFAEAAPETMSIEANDVTMSFAGSGIVTTNITTVTVSAAAGPSLFDIGLVGAAMGALLHQATNPPQTPQTPAAQQAPKKNCPPVPPHPKGADVDANIRATPATNAADPTGNGAKAWWVNQVKTNGVWDYKTQGIQYDDFGNFNYGATGAVFGFSSGTLEAGAVAARFFKSPLAQLKNNGLVNPAHKNDMIRQGMQYKQNDCGKS
jgi:RHS repeat-associated protein